VTGIPQTPGRVTSLQDVTPHAGWLAAWRRQLQDETVADAGRLAWVALQVAILFVLAAVFRIEYRVFYERVLPLVLAGFVLHHLAPARWRMSLFAALSVGSIWLVFGFVQGAWLMAVGLALITIVHLPFSLRVRMVVLGGAVAALAAMRVGVVPTPFTSAVWPILGSMFMFRLIVYVYDLRHLKERTTWGQRIAYFFAVPNVTFPLFPVVDFATFRRTYYDRRPVDIYQEGAGWIARGLTHLVLYRLVYAYATLSPVEVVDLASLVRYMLANFGLYLRVSGQFHLIVGILHLFGFRLPETHRFFYLASSFSDLWRRINIYWKDFMQKVVFLPVHFALRRRGEMAAVMGATLAVFVATWFFHSYQWFWLLGTWLWSLTDTMFWAILALCLVGNAWLELRRGRARTLRPPAWSLRASLGLGLRTAGIFSVMTVLWSLWTSPTLDEWLAMLARATPDVAGVGAIAATLAIVVLAAMLVDRVRPASGALAVRATATSSRPTMLALAPLALLYLAGEPAVRQHLPLGVASAMRDVRESQLNERDAAQLQRGYYEQLVGVDRFNGELWNVLAERPANWGNLREAGAQVPVDDARLHALLPGRYALHGATHTINGLGMRDREYPQTPSGAGPRIALLGQSYVMGLGVEDDETFDARIERSGQIAGIEVLNFGAPAYTLPQQVALLEHGEVGRFRPDVVLLVLHGNEFEGIEQYVLDLRRRKMTFADDSIERRLQHAGVYEARSNAEARRAVLPLEPMVVRWGLRKIATLAGDIGARPVAVLIPTPMSSVERSRAGLLAAAADAGFEVIDMSDVYLASDERALIVAEWDRHPNDEGHRVIADRLVRELRARPGLLSHRRPGTIVQPDHPVP